MRKITVAILCVIAGGVLGWGSLVASYPAPGTSNLNGIGYVNSTTMCATTNTPDYVWKFNRSNGSVTSSFAAPTTNTAGCDYGVVGSTAYIFVCTGSYVYRMGYSTGSIYGSWATPDPDCRGVAFQPFWSTPYIVLTESFTPGRIFRCDAITGSVSASFNLGFRPYGIAWDDRNECYWVTDLTHGLVRRISNEGLTLGSFSINYDGYGLAYDEFSERVWVGRNDPHYMYVYETAGSAVEPASLGKVKAIYR